MASSGVCTSAQMPPAMAKSVRMMTRNWLRALASMTRSMSDVERGSVGASERWSVGASERGASGGPGVGGGSVLICLICALSRSPRLHRPLNLRFRVDQEIGAGDHSLAFAQAAPDFIIAAEFAAKLHKTRLQPALTFVHEHQVAFACRHHRLNR